MNAWQSYIKINNAEIKTCAKNGHSSPTYIWAECSETRWNILLNVALQVHFSLSSAL